MAKKISDIERLVGFAMSASEDTLNSAIQSLVAIRNNLFPAEKKSRKPRKSKEAKPEKTKAATATLDDPGLTARQCINCGWKGKTIHPEPCPKCGEKTEEVSKA